MNGQTKCDVGTPQNITQPRKKGNYDTGYNIDETCGH